MANVQLEPLRSDAELKPSTPRRSSPPPVENPRGKTPIGPTATPARSRPLTPILVQPRPPPTPAAVQVRRGPQVEEAAEGPLVPTLNAASTVFDAKTGITTKTGDGDVALLTDADKSDRTTPDFDVVFIGEVPAELECKVCSQVLRIPQQLPCGHLFCLVCVRELSECPTCGRKFKVEALREDKPTARRIQQLEVKCSFFDNGCTWAGVLKELKAHAVSCEFADTICPRGCGEVFAKRDESQHLAECTRKTIACVHCGKEVSERSMRTHLKLCPSMIVDCPNLCGLKQKTRAEIQEHLPACPKRESVCPFGEFGCEYTGGRENLQRHIKEELTHHLSFLCTGVVEFRELVAAAYLNLEKMSRNTSVLQGRIDALEKLYGAQYVWRIDDYRRRFDDARNGKQTLLFSPPFLSGRHGYKLVLSVGLFGDGPAHGQYLSVYVCILRGDHDALLSWPFVHMITLTVMDQNPKVHERKHLTYAIKPNPTNENRPYLERPRAERNSAFGAQKFCSLADIQPFVREDVLFIRCKVDTENMIVL